MNYRSVNIYKPVIEIAVTTKELVFPINFINDMKMQ